MENQEKKLPSAFTMMKNFSKELKDFVLKGMPSVSSKDYQDRIDTCFSCPHFLENVNRCGACGCLVEYKARWKTTTCPKDHWKKQDIDVKDK